MKLIIDIDEKTYKDLKQFYDNMSEYECIGKYELAIAEGIPFDDIKVEIQNTILEQAYEKGAIDELEKIIAEIDKIRSEEKNVDSNWCAGLKYVNNKIIDKHISQLKGRNKSEQADTEFNHKAFYEYLLNVINPNEMEKYRSMFLSSGEIVN